jgi:hypothetical protein
MVHREKCDIHVCEVVAIRILSKIQRKSLRERYNVRESNVYGQYPELGPSSRKELQV